MRTVPPVFQNCVQKFASIDSNLVQKFAYNFPILRTSTYGWHHCYQYRLTLSLVSVVSQFTKSKTSNPNSENSFLVMMKGHIMGYRAEMPR
jgi:hypothetical protein